MRKELTFMRILHRLTLIGNFPKFDCITNSIVINAGFASQVEYMDRDSGFVTDKV